MFPSSRAPASPRSFARIARPHDVRVIVLLLVLAWSPQASAQYTPAPAGDAGAPPTSASASGVDAGSSPAPSARWTTPATPAPSSSAEKPPKPDPGPALRERGAGRRRANPASGAFFALVIVAMLLYWVVKRLRR